MFVTRSVRVFLGHNFGTEMFVTHSVREMIDFLMSILSTPFCVHADKTSNFVDLLKFRTSPLRGWLRQKS